MRPSEKDVAIVSQALARRLFGDTNPLAARTGLLSIKP
jgi:hypothetical protein